MWASMKFLPFLSYMGMGLRLVAHGAEGASLFNNYSPQAR